MKNRVDLKMRLQSKMKNQLNRVRTKVDLKINFLNKPVINLSPNKTIQVNSPNKTTNQFIQLRMRVDIQMNYLTKLMNPLSPSITILMTLRTWMKNLLRLLMM